MFFILPLDHEEVLIRAGIPCLSFLRLTVTLVVERRK